MRYGDSLVISYAVYEPSFSRNRTIWEAALGCRFAEIAFLNATAGQPGCAWAQAARATAIANASWILIRLTRRLGFLPVRIINCKCCSSHICLKTKCRAQVARGGAIHRCGKRICVQRALGSPRAGEAAT